MAWEKAHEIRTMMLLEAPYPRDSGNGKYILYQGLRVNTLGGGDYQKLGLGFSVQGLLCWRIECRFTWSSTGSIKGTAQRHCS